MLHSVYVDTVDEKSGADRVFYLNSAYNPWSATDPQQGYWFDQMSALFQKNFVVRTRYKITAPARTTDQLYYAAVPSTASSSLLANAWRDLVVRQDAKGTSVNTVHTKENVVLAEGMVETKKWYPYKDWLDADDLQGTYGSSPTLKVYLHCIKVPSTTTVNMPIIYELWQDTIFFSPYPQAVS